ncbi:MAG: RidA family protein [Promethearchaeia archaeon]
MAASNAQTQIQTHTPTISLSHTKSTQVGYLKCGSWRVEPKAPRTSAAPAQVHLVTDEDAATVARLEPAAAACGRERASAPSEANRPADTPSLHCGHGMLLLAARTARDVAVSRAVSRAEGVAVKTAGDAGMARCGGTACEWASVAEEAEQILEAIEVELREAGMTWQQVSMVGVYLHDMADFAAVNEVYARYLPMRTPAARLCVALHALPTTTRSAAGEQDRRGGERVAIECSAWPGQQTTLHVQSVSRWAPSNIGPYSQAKTLAGRLVFVSGQIGLDPASMSLVDKSALSQGRQCLRNLQAILGSCDSSLSRVARATIFVTSMSDAEELLALWRHATQDHSLQAPGQQGPKCSVSLVEVAGLPRGALVEYQVTALTNAGGSLKAWGEEEAQPPDPLSPLPDTLGCDDDPSVGCKAVQCVATGCGQEGAREGAREERWCAATLACTCTRLATDDKEIARAGLVLGRRVLDCLRAHGLTAEDLVSLRLLMATASDTTQTAAANEGKGTTARAGATTGQQALIAALRDAVLDCLHASSVTRGHGTAEAGRWLGRGAATNGGGGRRQVTVMPVRRLAIPSPATAHDSPLPVQLLLEMLAFGGG